MRIQHNIMAMNAYRNYNTNTSALSKNLEKLSSGYKINRAGDDAAGLAISEKMRAQITGLNAASKNVKDGISLVKTAEGAMQEIQDMLNRMDYLATQSANGTYDNEVDRAALQKEVDQLKSEINRIADSANFNGIKLLDGKMDAGGREVSGDFIIPDEGKTLGTETLLRTPGTEKAKSSLTLDLDTLEWDAKANDKLEINIGDETITVTANADGKIDAKALAQKVADAFNNDGKFGADDVATTATANGTSVTFTANAEGKGFDVNQDVTMKLTTADGDIMELNAGVIVPMANTGAIDNTDAKSDIALKDTTTGTAEAKDALATFLDEQDAADGNVSVKYENSKWSISVGDKSIEATATVNEGVLSLSINDGQNDVEVLTITASDKGAGTSNDEAAFQTAFGTAVDTGIKYVAPAGGTDPVDPPPEKPELKNDVTSSEVLDTAGINFKAADLTQEKLDAAKLAAVTGKITITDATADIEIDLAEVAKGLTANISTTKDLVDGILAEANKAIEAWNTANAETAGYKYGNVRISNDNAQNGIIAQAAGDGIKVIVDQQPLANDPPANSPLSGNFNAATTKNVVGSDGKAGQYASTTFELKDIVDKGNLDGAVVEIAGEKYTFKLGDGYSIDGNTITLDKSLTGEALLDQAGTGLSKMANKNFTIGHEGNGKIVIDEIAGGAPDKDVQKKLTTVEDFNSLLKFSTKTATVDKNGLTLQIGDTSDDYNQLKVSIGDMHTSAMGIAALNIGNQEDAADAIQTIRNAINYVSGVRGDLGATQNRLEHTANNLSVMAENIQDAESTIRDTDVAEEMMSYVKNNILVQSAQAMLAQANQVPQGVLQLLG